MPLIFHRVTFETNPQKQHSDIQGHKWLESCFSLHQKVPFITFFFFFSFFIFLYFCTFNLVKGSNVGWLFPLPFLFLLLSNAFNGNVDPVLISELNWNCSVKWKRFLQSILISECFNVKAGYSAWEAHTERASRVGRVKETTALACFSKCGGSHGGGKKKTNEVFLGILGKVSCSGKWINVLQEPVIRGGLGSRQCLEYSLAF